MPREVRFYECCEPDCGNQYDTWSGAQECEWTHEYAKEQEV